MKLILSSCDFDNEKSKQVIINNINKPLAENKVLFIPNEKATKDKIYSNKYYDRLYEKGFTNKNNIYIFDHNQADKFRNLDIDLIYVSGGNTFGTLDKLRKCDFCNDIINYVKNDAIYIGGSAGSLITTKNIEHIQNFDSNEVNMNDYNALNLVNILLIPHYEEDEYRPCDRKKLYNEMKNKFDNIYTLTNQESLVIEDNRINKY